LDDLRSSGTQQQILQTDQKDVESDEASEAIDSVSCQNVCEDAEAEGRNSALNSETIFSSTTGRKEQITAERLAESALHCLGEPFIDRSVDEV
jgi:hypothetical protein